MPKTVRLAIYFNDELRAVKKLALPFVIGRSHDVNLTIPHPMVSRRHCLIFEDNGTIRLQDLGSLNGTYLDTQRIMTLELEPDSEFLIGNIRFVFNPTDTVQNPTSPTAPDSDIVKAEVNLSPRDDLPPPLPSTPPQPVAFNSTAPSFIKPLSLPPDEKNGILVLNDVIDLANIPDKDASSPPLGEQK